MKDMRVDVHLEHKTLANIVVYGLFAEAVVCCNSDKNFTLMGTLN